MTRWVLFGLATLLAACSSTPGPDHPVHGVTPDGVPRWVNRGSGAYEGEHGKAFYGVGILAGVQNPGLARQAVDDRARGAIARMFHTYVAAMMKDYQRSTTAGDFSASAEEQDIVSVQKTLTDATLRGVMIKDHWVDPADGTRYALAVLELDGFMSSLDDVKQLNARVRDYVRANARRAFDDLDRELRKHNERQGM